MGLVHLHCLSQALAPTSSISALVLLNGPPISRKLLELVWPSSAVSCPVICADGAANLLFNSLPDRIPTHLVGDMDSICPDVRAHYEARGTKVILRPSQDSCDCTKAIETACEVGICREGSPVLIVGGYPGAGRLDHLFGNLHTLCSFAEKGRQAWWVGEQSASMILTSGRHQFAIDRSIEGVLCGLVPIAGPVTQISTRGLKWNLAKQEMRFGIGGLVSTSNEIAEAFVDVETNGTLLWTTEFSLHR